MENKNIPCPVCGGPSEDWVMINTPYSNSNKFACETPIADNLALPCPFCNSGHLHHESVSNCRYIRCQSCSASGGYVWSWRAKFTKEESIRIWNERKTN